MIGTDVEFVPENDDKPPMGYPFFYREQCIADAFLLFLRDISNVDAQVPITEIVFDLVAEVANDDDHVPNPELITHELDISL